MLMALTAILLAAGYATRLYPLTKDKPKALLPLRDGVILDEVFSKLGPDVTKRILVTNHCFAHLFRQWRAQRQADVEILDDGTATPETRLGAIRDLELARLQGQAAGDLLVVGTDNLFTWSLTEFIARARRHAPDASVALWEAPSKQAATQFGVVTLNGESRIRAFVEKSRQPPSAAVAICLYYFPEPMCGMMRQFLDEAPNADAPGYFIEWLVDRSAVYGVMMQGIWYDIGTRETYEAARRDWGAGEIT
jgi:glucose-1-phosphate thymidylyltransferase